MTEKIRVGVIGVGKLGQHHARIYSTMPDVLLVGVCDADESRAKDVAKKYTAQWYREYAQLIGCVDAVSIAVPTPLHHEVASRFLDARVHCLVEKPITVTMEHAEDLVQRACHNNVVLQVGHIERFNPAVIEAQKYIHHPRFIDVNRLGPYDPRVSHVGVVLDLMIHDLDIVMFLTGAQVVSLEAVGAKVFSQCEDIANARIRFDNGCVANISASRISLDTMRKIRIFQDEAYLSLDYEKQHLKIYRKKHATVSSFRDIDMIAPKIQKSEPLLMELSDFIRCVRVGATPIVDGVRGKNALELALEITNRIAMLHA